MTLKIGDKVVTKKPHACGGSEFTVTRTGADCKLTCLKCGKTVLMLLEKTLKAVKRIIPEETL